MPIEGGGRATAAAVSQVRLGRLFPNAHYVKVRKSTYYGATTVSHAKDAKQQ